MSELTLPTFDECFNKLEILKKMGHSAAITDFAILLGGAYSELKGDYWTKTDDYLRSCDCGYFHG